MTAKEWYDNYLEEFEYEIGTLKDCMNYDRWKEFWGIDESTTEEQLADIFWF